MREFSFSIQIDNPTGDIVFDPVSGMNSWRQVPEVIPEFTFELADTSSVRLLFAWNRTTEYIEIANSRTAENAVSGGMFEWPSYFFESPPNDQHTDPPLNFSCVVQTSSGKVDADNAKEYVQFFLMQLFLALNLSTPGCFDLSSAYIIKSNSKKEQFPHFSSFFLRTAYELSHKQGWPIISHIPLLETWKWFNQLSPRPHLIARSRTEKALFALLHTCLNSDDLLVPTDVIWLAHALEALFDTPQTGIGKALRDRIFLVLDKPASHQNKIKKFITSFYKLRSMFVHGELDIALPILFGEETTPLEERIIEESEFAISLVIASLQLLIRNNWKGFEFSESFAGQSF